MPRRRRRRGDRGRSGPCRRSPPPVGSAAAHRLPEAPAWLLTAEGASASPRPDPTLPRRPLRRHAPAEPAAPGPGAEVSADVSCHARAGACGIRSAPRTQHGPRIPAGRDPGRFRARARTESSRWRPPDGLSARPVQRERNLVVGRDPVESVAPECVTPSAQDPVSRAHAFRDERRQRPAPWPAARVVAGAVGPVAASRAATSGAVRCTTVG